MPRRNLHYLVFTAIVSLLCYFRADSVHRGHYEAMKETFFSALGKIEEHYLYKVDERDLFDGAMQGMVRKLDKNSAYLTQDETRQFTQTIQQEFGGIGIEVTWDNKEGGLIVLSPIVGTPAYKAGILAGDRIVKIENEPTKGMTLQDAVRRLQGKAGDEVRLTVTHPDDPDQVEYAITREIINVQSVLGDSRNADDSWRFTLEEDPTIGYIRISQFGARTATELDEALAQCQTAGVRGLIIDLRNNPGGLLTQATEVCDKFLRSGVIVTTVNRDKETIEQYEATGQAKYPTMPLAIIVNGHSASAAEIVAACLQDHQRAVVIGERTYGKGTVQSPFALEDGKSILKLTIAEYLSPQGRNIHKHEGAKDTDVWGVSPKPEHEVKLSPEAEIAIAVRRRDRDVVRRPKPKGPSSGNPSSGIPTASSTSSPSATPSATAKPTATANRTVTTKPSGTPSASATASPSGTRKPAATPTATGKPSDAKKGGEEPGEDKTEPAAEIPDNDPQLERAIEYFQAKPSTVRAA
jgi:carboxyl-terminal processing protease